MKKKFIWLGLSFLLVAVMIFTSCSTKTTSTTSSASTTTASKITTTTSKTTGTVTVTTATTTTTQASGNWWDSLGTPQYGGRITYQMGANIAGWDPYNFAGNNFICYSWMEQLFANNWLTDPKEYAFKGMWVPPDYNQGLLAESWEMPDMNTVIIHLHHGITYQNIAPSYGREFTADDLKFVFDRRFGIGSGFTVPQPFIETPGWLKLQSVTVKDKYTDVFTFSGLSQEGILEAIIGGGAPIMCEDPDVVKKYGDTTDWHNACGTGPFILTDYVSDSSATLKRNPTYWKTDERYPNNKLPYIDGCTYLIILDPATGQSALRTGKIDIMGNIGAITAASLKKTDPNLLYAASTSGMSLTLNPVVDVPPYSDIKVRIAQQKAIDVSTIGAANYPGASTDPATLTSGDIAGWGWPYSQWPQDLKDEYKYDPPAAIKLLADAGYPNGFDVNIYAQNTADQEMLEICQSYLAKVNIRMTIKLMDVATWNDFVQTNKKTDGMSYKYWGGLDYSFPPVDQLGIYQPGGSFNSSRVTDQVFVDAFNKATAAGATTADAKAAVQSANEEMARMHYVTSLLTPVSFAFYQPWIKGFSFQDSSIPQGTNSSQLTAFYGARFWIDQSLKK